jgi:protein involved in polysaccharide export with SLBB domain
MKSFGNTILLCTLAAVAGAAACADPPPSHYPTPHANMNDATLGARDVIEVRVYRQEDVSGEFEVSPECNISYPLIGAVEVCGKTPPQVERMIREKLADGYIKDPQVSVLVKEYKSKTVSVFGQVKKPGTLPYAGGMTVVEAISQAGGFTEMARKNAVTVTRLAKGKKVHYTVPVESIGQGDADNFVVLPGDVVHVPRRIW